MLKITLGILALLSSIAPALAGYTWFGNVVVQNIHRGTTTRTPFTGQVVKDNIADYNNFTLEFDFYNEGVTDADGIAVWEKIDARVELVRDSSQKVIARGFANFKRRIDNNAHYEVSFDAFAPSTVATVDPEMANRKRMGTHLNVILDGVQKVSVPVEWSYQP